MACEREINSREREINPREKEINLRKINLRKKEINFRKKDLSWVITHGVHAALRLPPSFADMMHRRAHQPPPLVAMNFTT